jgi:hypothetical protein
VGTLIPWWLQCSQLVWPYLTCLSAVHMMNEWAKWGSKIQITWSPPLPPKKYHNDCWHFWNANRHNSAIMQEQTTEAAFALNIDRFHSFTPYHPLQYFFNYKWDDESVEW